MTHFGIMCPGTLGHLYPMLSLSHELQKRGHQFTYFGPLDAEERISKAGINFCALGKSEFPMGALATFLKRVGQTSGLNVLRLCLKEQCKEARVILRDAPAAMRQVGLEALIIDQTILSGETLADILDIPFVNVCNALMLNRENGVPCSFTHSSYSSAWWAYLRNQVCYSALYQLAKPIKNIVNQHRQQWKLPLYSFSSEPYSRLLQLGQQPIEFEFPRVNLPQCFHFTGPFSTQAVRAPSCFPFDKLTEKPLIYASLGTIQNRLHWVFHAIAEACLGLDAQLVISVGRSGDLDSFANLPGNPLVAKMPPQLELLKRAALTITHAGMNTTLESLSYGVPMVAIPIGNDCSGIAARIAWTGCGERVPVSRLNVPRLRSAIQRVLMEDTYRNNALKLQNAIYRAGGVKKAADLIEQAVSTRKPVVREKLCLQTSGI